MERVTVWNGTSLPDRGAGSVGLMIMRSGSKQWLSIGICASAFVLGACGGGPTSTARGNSVLEFPGRDVLSSIAAKPVGKVSRQRTAEAADAWTIEAAPAVDKAQDTWAPSNSWETLFDEVAKAETPKTRLSQGMGCAARELGRFFLAKKTLPDDGLQRFMVGGCGNVVPDVDIQYFLLDLPPNMPDDRLFSDGSPKNRPLLAKSLSHKPDVAGFWFGRKDNLMTMFVVSARETARIKPFSLAPDERGEVLLEGEALQPTQYFNAYVNRGTAAVATCEIDMSVPKPGFRIVCPVDKNDETAWIQLISVPPKRALGSVFLQTLLRQNSDTQPHYAAVHYGDPSPATTPGEFSSSVLTNLNRARREAGLAQLSLAAEQSHTAASVAPHYFSAMFGDKPDPANADTITLALMAGWDVRGMIRDAHLVSTMAATLDSSRWLTSALEMPIGRKTLMDPDIEQLALGPVVFQEQRMLGAVSVGYRFHHGADHADDEKYLLSRVMQTRSRLRLSSPVRLSGVDLILNEELLKVHQNEKSPKEALDATLQRSVEQFQRSMRGYVIQTSSLEELQLPDEVLRQPTLHLDIGVSHFKPENGAWAQYAIIVVYAVDG